MQAVGPTGYPGLETLSSLPPGGAPIQLARPGGNPRGRGGRGQFQRPPPPPRRQPAHLDRGSLANASRERAGRHEREQATRERLQRRLAERQEAAFQEAMAPRPQAPAEPLSPPPTALEPVEHEPPPQEAVEEVKERPRPTEEERTVKAHQQMTRMQGFLAAKAREVDEYRTPYDPTALQRANRAAAIAQRLAAHRDGVATEEHGTARSARDEAKALQDELVGQVGGDKLAELIAAHKQESAQRAEEQRRQEQIRRSREAQQQRDAERKEAIQDEADAYLSEMSAKFNAYNNDSSINRGAYYGHPNGQPPARYNRISAEAMAIVRHEAPRRGFRLQGSLTSSVSFHKAPTKHTSGDFIFHA